jgi:hypothetical protein
MQALESIINTIIATLSAALVGLVALAGSLFPTLALAPEPPAIEQITAVATSSPQATSTSAGAEKPAPQNGLVEAEPTRGPFVGQVSSTSTPQKPVSTPSITSTPPAPKPAKSQEQVNDETRAALVNILCLSKQGINGVSGTGIIVDSRGVILTNAHIAQYFLLRDYLAKDNIECTIRVGSPAARMYTASLLYLPPTWVTENASQLKASQATGTGEHDYALLLITGRTDPSAALPSSFARVPMENSYPDIGNPMLLAAYPAGFLGGETIEKNLYSSSAVTYVTQLFSFNNDIKKVDLFSIGGTVVSQAGSSGGAVVRLESGKLAGMIATATVGTNTGSRDLRAITMAHINASLAAHGMGGLTTLLSGDLVAKAASFAATTAVSERAALEAALKN